MLELEEGEPAQAQLYLRKAIDRDAASASGLYRYADFSSRSTPAAELIPSLVRSPMTLLRP